MLLRVVITFCVYVSLMECLFSSMAGLLHGGSLQLCTQHRPQQRAWTEQQQ